MIYTASLRVAVRGQTHFLDMATDTSDCLDGNEDGLQKQSLSVHCFKEREASLITYMEKHSYLCSKVILLQHLIDSI